MKTKFTRAIITGRLEGHQFKIASIVSLTSPGAATDEELEQAFIKNGNADKEDIKASFNRKDNYSATVHNGVCVMVAKVVSLGSLIGFKGEL